MMMGAMHTWDPERYLTYADERGRPFVELVSRIGAPAPATVVDLGCGPGNLTALLVERWPDARVTGLDSSAEMVEKARATTPAVEFRVADLRDWVAGGEQVAVLVSNATLQWVPGHLELLPDLVARVAPGGWLAFQVPGNFGEPSHTIRSELAAEAPYAAYTAGVAVPSSHDPVVYLGALLRGRRLGDDVPPRSRGRGPGVHLGFRHRGAADAAGAAGGPEDSVRG
jgi:trans-aconitate 2-methyltransferase